MHTSFCCWDFPSRCISGCTLRIHRDIHSPFAVHNLSSLCFRCIYRLDGLTTRTDLMTQKVLRERSTVTVVVPSNGKFAASLSNLVWRRSRATSTLLLASSSCFDTFWVLYPCPNHSKTLPEVQRNEDYQLLSSTILLTPHCTLLWLRRPMLAHRLPRVTRRC